MHTVIVASLVSGIIATINPALAEPLYCSMSFQGYRVCSSPGGYTSTEWSRDGMRFGQDSDGNRWTTSRWRDIDITTVTPSER